MERAMKVKDLMTTPVKTCRPSALLGDAARIMLDEECGCVPVVDAHGRIAGMLTDRDICLASIARRQDPWEIPVRDVMSPNIVSCLAADHITAALVAMKEHRVRRIPVVDDDGRVTGILSIDDVIRNTGIAKGRLAAEPVMDVLRHICTRAEDELVLTTAE
jgi:CBS domain-containing protein